MSSDQFSIFQVPVWGYVLNDQKYHNFDYIQRLLELEEKETSSKKSNFGGFQTRDNINETEGVFRELILLINKIANDCFLNFIKTRSLHTKIYNEVKVTEMWGNINYPNSFNGAHTHSGLISGVFYCQVSENSGNLVLINPAVRSDGHILRESNFTITPQPLALIMFPSWLEHYVEPNRSSDTRISISFNIG